MALFCERAGRLTAQNGGFRPAGQVTLDSPNVMGWIEGERPATSHEEVLQNLRVEGASQNLESLLSFYTNGDAEEVLLHSYYDTAKELSTEADPHVAQVGVDGKVIITPPCIFH